MSKLNKFEDVDVFAFLNAIMKQNTGFYQSDFDIDREIIAKTADRKSTRLNSSHSGESRMPSSA